MPSFRKPSSDAYEDLKLEIHQLRQELFDYKNLKTPTIPEYDSAGGGFPNSAVEGQIAIDRSGGETLTDGSSLIYYHQGQWIKSSGEGGGTLSTIARNMTQLGYTGSGTQANSRQHLLTNKDVEVGDGILVMASAPSKPSSGEPVGLPNGVTDTKGNTYSLRIQKKFEANPANVNEGVVVSFYYAPCTTKLVAGTDSVTATWSNPVFDRVVGAWHIHHDGGATAPTVLASTANNDIATYADTKNTLTVPGWTPTRDNSFMFAVLSFAKVGGPGGWGGVIGWSGFFQDTGYNFTGGSKQQYYAFHQTAGADALIVGGSGFELDLGKLIGGIPVGSFNGVAQNYSNGANAWKGITLFSVT